MACRTETKEIGDHEYSVTQWPADRALLTKFKLLKMFGSSLALLSGGETGGEGNDHINSELLSKGISGLFENNSPEEITSLLKDCVVGVACDGKKLTEATFTELFSGDTLLESYQVFFFVLKVNYANLMGGQLAERLLAQIKTSL